MGQGELSRSRAFPGPFEAVKTLDRISLQDGEKPSVGVMLQTLENSSSPGMP